MNVAHRAKLFRNGGSQAVRLPKDCRFRGDEVLVRRDGNRVILEQLKRQWDARVLEFFAEPPAAAFPARKEPSRADSRVELDP